MYKTILIKGMSCSHCAARVEKALNKIDGINATVDLASRSARLELSKNIPDETIRVSVDEAGYEVTNILG